MAATRDAIDDLDWRTKEVTSRVESKVMYHQDSLLEYTNIRLVINGLTQQKEKMEQKHYAMKELVLPMEQELVVVKEELEEAREECEAAKVELMEAKEQLAEKNRELDEMNKELQALRKKLQESQAMEAKLEQQHGVAPEPVQSTRETRSARKKRMIPPESLGNDANKHHLKKDRSCQQLPNNLTLGHHASRGDDLELQAMRKKLQESQAMEAQLEQQHGIAPEPVQSTRETRSARKRKMAPHDSLENDANKHHLQKERSCMQLPNNLTNGHHASRGDDLAVVRQKIIEGFKEIDGGRYLGVKAMGKLNEKPFRDACAQKLPRKESVMEASKLYSLWEELLNNPEWNPFKTDTVDDNCQEEVIDAYDEKLQQLKMAWGEGPYSSVITALVERKEYNTDGTSIFELWNYKERRKATLEECVESIFSQVKKLKQFHLRTLRSRRHSVC